MKTQEIKKLLKEQRMYPKKGLGQHFLVHEGMLELISKAASLKKGDVVLEVGPGLGVLTKTLAERVKRVVAVEKDPAMVSILDKTIAKEYPNVEIIQADILSLAKPSWLSQLGLAKEYKVVANLPYYITSPVIRKFLEAKVQPKVMVLMVQKEVARRICAKPPRMNLLAVSVQAYAEPEIVSIVPKNAFWPQPKVESAILKITPLIDADRKLIDVVQTLKSLQTRRADTFFKVVKAGFKQPRKQLAGNLSKGLGIPREEAEKILSQHNLNPAARAETLHLEDWHSLAKSFSKK